MGEGLASFQRRMKAIPKAARLAVGPAVLGAAETVAETQRALAEGSRDTGALIGSIAVTGPGEQTPAYSQPGGGAIVGPLSAAVTVGNAEVRYPHLVEYGTTKAHAQPFFWPGFRLARKKAAAKIKRAIGKAIKGAK